MIFTYQNRQNSLYNKTNTREKNNVVVAAYQPPPEDIQANRSIYTTVGVPDPKTNTVKYTRVLVTPQRNPIKHYRRQYTSKVEKNVSDLRAINMPGKTIVKSTDDCPTCDLSNTLFTKELIENNNQQCYATYSYQDTDPYLWRTIGCNTKNNIVKPAQTNMSQQYSSSMAVLRERRGQTYSNNRCQQKQKLIKNGGECSNGTYSEFFTNKHPINNGSTSISSYRRQYTKNYNEEINLLNNYLCCNNIVPKDPNYTICDPHVYPNLTQKKNICVDIT